MRVSTSASRCTAVRRASTNARRFGFTLAELLVSLVLFGLVAGGILTMLQRQQRFYGSANAIVSMRTQLRQGLTVLPFDLRWVSTSDTTVNSSATKHEADVYARSDDAIEFRQVIGTSVMCGKKATAPADTVIILPQSLSVMATSFAVTPVVGDSILILDEGTMPGELDDKWKPYEITAINAASGTKGCPFVASAAAFGTGELLTAADTGKSSYRLTISPTLSISTGTDVPVRIFRRARYQLYQAADSKYYVGYSDCLRTYATATKCSALTPIAGPFLPNSGSMTGLSFVFYDSTGAKVANGLGLPASKIARIDITLRSETRRSVDRTGMTVLPTKYRDSVAVTIGLRNRR
jgi:prepilin-type N-terminal cleavage/methylation domain-containing protein